MCHNHSHLLGHLLGEDSSTPLPALTIALAHNTLKVELGQSASGLLMLKTTGLLRVPSLMLAGCSLPLQPVTGAWPMSLFLLPEDAMTTILRATWAWMNASEKSLSQWVNMEHPHPAIQKSEDEMDYESPIAGNRGTRGPGVPFFEDGGDL